MVVLVNMDGVAAGLTSAKDAESINERMIKEGYAWSYDGGTKNKDFQQLRVGFEQVLNT